MDTGDGQFKRIPEKKFQEQMLEPKPRVFKEGEILEIRGSRLRVEKILRNKLILKVLPDGTNQT